MSNALRRVKAEHRPHERYTIEQKFAAVEAWLLYGNLKLVTELTGIGYSLIKSWRGTEWWRDLEREILAGARIKQSSTISRIVDKGLEVVSDRLENGEVVLDQKTGELVRRPVTLRDSATAVNALMQRQSILEKQAHDEFTSEGNKTIQEQLQILAQEFAKFNGRSKLGATDIEYVEITDAVHDEREEGLQEGSGEVYEPPGSSEEAGNAEQGSSSDDEEGLGSQGGWEGRGSQDSSLEGWDGESEEPESGASLEESFFQPKP